MLLIFLWLSYFVTVAIIPSRQMRSQKADASKIFEYISMYAGVLKMNLNGEHDPLKPKKNSNDQHQICNDSNATEK